MPQNNIVHDEQFSTIFKEIHEKTLSLLEPLAVNRTIPNCIYLREYDAHTNTGKGISSEKLRKSKNTNILDGYEGDEGIVLPDPTRIIVNSSNISHTHLPKEIASTLYHETGHVVVGPRPYYIESSFKLWPTNFGELGTSINYVWNFLQNAIYQKKGSYVNPFFEPFTFQKDPVPFRLSLDEFYADIAGQLGSPYLIDRSSTKNGTFASIARFIKSPRFIPLAQIQKNPEKAVEWLNDLQTYSTHIPAWAAQNLLLRESSLENVFNGGYLEMQPEELWQEHLAPLPLE